MGKDLLVYVVDDDAPVRDAIARLLRAEGLRVRDFGSAEALLDAVRPADAGCLVLDIHMPGMDGLELQRRLAELRVDLPIVFLTGHGDVPTSARAFRSGAVDFLEKPVEGDRLVSSVREALERSTQTAERNARRARIEARLADLTRREREVMALVVRGLSSKEIARELGISHRTVESHRARIMDKMQAQTLPALVEMATLGDVDA